MKGVAPLDVIYARKSLDKEQRNSIEMQVTLGRNRAKAMGRFISKVYIDSGISARSIDMYHRHDLCQLIEDIKKGLVKRIYVYKRDRFARRAVEYLKIYQLIIEYNVEVIFTCTEEPPIMKGDIGKFIEFIFAGQLENEGNLIVTRIIETQKASFLMGKWVGTLPYGFFYEKGQVEQKEDEVNNIKYIFANYAEDVPVAAITEKLNSDNNNLYKGRPWKDKDINSIIENPTYMGIRSFYGGELVKEFEFLKIVKPEIWEKAQQRRKRERESRNRQITNSKVQIKEKPLLLGKIICAECGQIYGIKTRYLKEGQVFYYCCDKKENHFDSKARFIKKDIIEEFVVKETANYFNTIKIYNLNEYVNASINNIRTALSKKLCVNDKDLEIQKRRLSKRIEKYISDTNNKSKKEEEEISYIKQQINILKEKETRIKTKAEQINDLFDHVVLSLKIFADESIINSLSYSDLGKLINSIVEQVVIDDSLIDIKFKYPFIFKGVVVNW